LDATTCRSMPQHAGSFRSRDERCQSVAIVVLYSLKASRHKSGLYIIICVPLHVHCVFQIWNTAKKAGKKVATLMWPGSEINIQGV